MRHLLPEAIAGIAGSGRDQDQPGVGMGKREGAGEAAWDRGGGQRGPGRGAQKVGVSVLDFLKTKASVCGGILISVLVVRLGNQDCSSCLSQGSTCPTKLAVVQMLGNGDCSL